MKEPDVMEFRQRKPFGLRAPSTVGHPALPRGAPMGRARNNPVNC